MRHGYSTYCAAPRAEQLKGGTVERMRPSRRHSRNKLLLAATTGMLGLIGVLSLPAPYAASSRGPVIPLQATGSAVMDRGAGGSLRGSLLLTTVRSESLTYFETVVAMLRKRPVVRLTGGASSAQEEMEASLSAARAAALGLADASTRAAATRLLEVRFVQDASPASSADVRVGDRIRLVDGVVPGSVAEVFERIGRPGEHALVVERAGDVLSQTMQTNVAGITGMVLGARLDPRPLDLDVAVGVVGGASGGLQITLAFLDALSAGDLTGGLRVAGSGTVDSSGRVGPVTSLALKYDAARVAGADVFFLPVGQSSELRARRGGPLVVEVHSVAEAVSWLCTHGGRAPSCPDDTGSR